MNEILKTYIENEIKTNKIVVFMKGTRDFPHCGFSAKVVHIFNKLEVEYKDIDIFSEPELRDGMKEYSDWPTFPQIYINQEFIGGCDILTQMYESGELVSMVT